MTDAELSKALEVEAERDQLRIALTWRPIETAPRDGTMILARNASHSTMYVVGWQRAYGGDPFDEDHWDDVGSRNAAPALYFNANYFQHWAPLPEFP